MQQGFQRTGALPVGNKYFILIMGRGYLVNAETDFVFPVNRAVLSVADGQKGMLLIRGYSFL